jgi:hypothetical protein
MISDGEEGMTATTEIQDVFAAYGEVAQRIQLIEYNLVTLWLLDSVTQGISVTKEDLLGFEEDWGTKTLGYLLSPLKKSDLIPADLKSFLDELRVVRNEVVHSFFLDNDKELLTHAGRHRIVCNLRRINGQMEMGREFLDGVLGTYLKDFGVDVQAIRKQILAETESRWSE